MERALLLLLLTVSCVPPPGSTPREVAEPVWPECAELLTAQAFGGLDDQRGGPLLAGPDGSVWMVYRDLQDNEWGLRRHALDASILSEEAWPGVRLDDVALVDATDGRLLTATLSGGGWFDAAQLVGTTAGEPVVVRQNEKGQVVWVRFPAPGRPARVSGAGLLPDGGVALSSTESEQMSTVYRLSESGEVDWSVPLTGVEALQLELITEPQSGVITVGGSFSGIGVLDVEPGVEPGVLLDPSGPSGLVLSYDADGTLLSWFVTRGDAVARPLAGEPSGTTLVGGSYRGAVQFGEGAVSVAPGTQGASEGWIGRLGVEGVPLWITRAIVTPFGSGSAAETLAAGWLDNGDVVWLGRASGMVTLGPDGPDPVTWSEWSNSLFVARLDGDTGDVTCAVPFRSGETAPEILLGQGDDVIVAGTFAGSIELLSTGSALQASGEDVFFLRLRLGDGR